MANINDYLVWRGDLKIDEKFKMNEVDNMILARFSYLLFDKIEMNEEETIESISEKMKKFKNEEFNYNGDKELITNLGKSERYKEMIVTDYIKNNNRQVERQFSAITIHISDDEIYISFEGTDGSIAGWKEDFNLSFMDNIPSQIAGLDYLKMVAQKYPNKKIRMGGHSKGGNIAIYSAINVSEDIQKRIISVVNYDGPGFDIEKIKQNQNKEIIKKIKTYIPQNSVIGRIMEHEEKYEVALSTEKGIYQHDIYSWQVKRNNIIKLEKTTYESDRVNKTIKDWLKSTTLEQRKIFFDGVFEILFSTNATTIDEFLGSWIKNTPKLIETYRNLSEEDRKTITSMLKLFGKIYLQK